MEWVQRVLLADQWRRKREEKEKGERKNKEDKTRALQQHAGRSD